MNSNSANKRCTSTNNERFSSKIDLAVRIQYGVLPYKLSDKCEFEILLVQLDPTEPWTIPKGWPVKGLGPAKSAAREAYEWAGVHGTLGTKSIGIFSCMELFSVRSGGVPCEVSVFPMLVTVQNSKLSQVRAYKWRWFPLEEALDLLSNIELRELISHFAQKTTVDEKRKRLDAIAKSEGDGLVTIEEAAKKLNVTVRTLRRWVAAGQMPPRVRDGREKKFRLCDIEAKTSAVSIEEAAEALGVTVRTLRRWVALGKMPSRTNEGNKMKFRRADIQALTCQILPKQCRLD